MIPSTRTTTVLITPFGYLTMIPFSFFNNLASTPNCFIMNKSFIGILYYLWIPFLVQIHMIKHPVKLRRHANSSHLQSVIDLEDRCWLVSVHYKCNTCCPSATKLGPTCDEAATSFTSHRIPGTSDISKWYIQHSFCNVSKMEWVRSSSLMQSML